MPHGSYTQSGEGDHGGDEVHEMSDAQEMVTAFHRAFDIAIGTSPAVPDAATCALRVSLIQEEFAELCEALSQRDIEDTVIFCQALCIFWA